MIALRIRGLYAAALTQLFLQDPRWEIVQPDEVLRDRIARPWKMDSPDIDIDDVPDEQGQRETLRISGEAEAVHHALELLRTHCIDVLTRQDESEVGALYMGVVGIVSGARRHAVVYLGNGLVGVLPLRYEEQDLRTGTYLPVRIASPTADRDSRPELSRVLTVPGHYAVLSATKAVRLSKQITEPQQRERLQQLGATQNVGMWGIIWRTAAQHAADETLAEEVQRLYAEAQALENRLHDVTTVGRVRGGDIAVHVVLPGYAKTVCDTLRAELFPTLPGHHKYKARGDVYGATVDALEKELPAEVLRSRTANLSILSSINAMQQPIQSTLRLLRRTPAGQVRSQGDAERLNDDIYAGWVEVQRSLRQKYHYPQELQMQPASGDYCITRFHEGSWSYLTRYYRQDGTWQGDYASLTTPVAIFSDQIHVTDLRVTVVRGLTHPPEIVGMDALRQLHEQGIVSAALIEKAQEESAALMQQFMQGKPAASSDMAPS
jgi:hypothetical protein